MTNGWDRIWREIHKAACAPASSPRQGVSALIPFCLLASFDSAACLHNSQRVQKSNSPGSQFGPNSCAGPLLRRQHREGNETLFAEPDWKQQNITPHQTVRDWCSRVVFGLSCSKTHHCGAYMRCSETVIVWAGGMTEELLRGAMYSATFTDMSSETVNSPASNIPMPRLSISTSSSLRISYHRYSS